MKNFFTKVFKNGVIATLAMIALGLLLTFLPGFFANTICYILGTLCLIASLFYIYKAVKKESTVVNALSALAFLTLGLILVIFQRSIFDALPLTAGICLLFFGLLKLQTAFTFRKTNPLLFKKLLIPAAVNALLGILLIILRSQATDLVIRIIGVILLYCACEGIVVKLLIKADGSNTSVQEKNEKQLEAEYTDSTTPQDEN